MFESFTLEVLILVLLARKWFQCMLLSIVESRSKRKAKEVASKTFSRPKKPMLDQKETGKQ